MPRYSIDDQIAEVAREVQLRRNVYPGFIARGKYTKGEADDHLAKMEAALATLRWVKANIVHEPRHEQQQGSLFHRAKDPDT